MLRCCWNAEKHFRMRLGHLRAEKLSFTWSHCCQWNRANDSNFPTLNSSSTSEFRRPKYPRARSSNCDQLAASPANRNTSTKSTACICRTRKSIFPCDTHSRPIRSRTARETFQLHSSKRRLLVYGGIVTLTPNACWISWTNAFESLMFSLSLNFSVIFVIWATSFCSFFRVSNTIVLRAASSCRTHGKVLNC